MRRTTRRSLVGLVIVTAALLASLVGPSQAFAGPCYQVQAGTEWVTVCT
jgi:hypothetical protein